ncbi:MAG: FMN-binding protein [Deltaproteobacteria bacterium]|nr:FMN-binding protein [Deltaproteobacteria bacterium]
MAIIRQKGHSQAIKLLPLLFITLLLSCASAPQLGGPVNKYNLNNGSYEGSYKNGPNKARVKVTIESNRIINVEIIQHWAWRGKKAEPIIVKRIVENQSTKVDAVTGATNSSNVIMNAAQIAIEKARVEK